MPQNKQMKMQWIEINGVQTPLVLPQIWDADKQEWVVTSNVDPLPTLDNSVSSRLDNIEQKLDSVIDNDAVNTQATGSIVEEAVLKRMTTTLEPGQMIESNLLDNTNGDFSSIFVDLFAAHINRIKVVFRSFANEDDEHWISRIITKDLAVDFKQESYVRFEEIKLSPNYFKVTLENTDTNNAATLYNFIITKRRGR